MNLKQLSEVATNAGVDFMMYEGIMYDVMQGFKERATFAGIEDSFPRVYFLREELWAHCKKYTDVQDAIGLFLAGEEFYKSPVEPEEEVTIWRYLLWNIEGEGDRFWLTEFSEFARHYIDIQYERKTALTQAFNKRFPDVPKAVVQDGELLPITSDEAAQYELQSDLKAMETSFGIDDYLKRMKQAKAMCDQKADPAEILKLFY